MGVRQVRFKFANTVSITYTLYECWLQIFATDLSK